MIRQLILPLLVVSALPAQKVDFEKQIWPILEKRCVECHKAPYTDPKTGRLKKPKGRVELDSPDGIKKSKRGKLVKAGDGENSLMWEAITLPADDEDVMPPAKKGKPLTKAQTDLIKKWIDEGADFGKWKGADAGKSKGKTEKPKTGGKSGSSRSGKNKKKTSPLVSLAKNLQPIDAEVLAGFEKGPFKVRSVGDDNPLLSVTCYGETDAVDDARVADLLPLAANIAELNLASTQITDAAGETLAKMPRLIALDLRQTEIGNHGVAALAGCKELRSLNLYGTKVGDYGASALTKLAHLEEVYLWQTDVSAKTVVSLQEQKPDLRVVMAAELPEPMEDDGNQRRRRRR